MKRLNQFLLTVTIFVCAGYMVPQQFSIPVSGATKNSYNQNSFWAYPWGTSVTHKGVDIFAQEGTDIVSSTGGLVVYTGHLVKGGNAIIILGPKWRFHYYAHLKEIKTSFLTCTNRNELIGTVGTTGNAKGKAPHLHYTIKSIIPIPWRKDASIQGWKKMFYLNPVAYLNDCTN